MLRKKDDEWEVKWEKEYYDQKSYIKRLIRITPAIIQCSKKQKKEKNKQRKSEKKFVNQHEWWIGIWWIWQLKVDQILENYREETKQKLGREREGKITGMRTLSRWK